MAVGLMIARRLRLGGRRQSASAVWYGDAGPIQGWDGRRPPLQSLVDAGVIKINAFNAKGPPSRS